MICTQDSVTKSQPQLFVGYSSPVYGDDGTIVAGARLSVHRSYPLSNQWGGVGRIKPLDANGKLFASLQEARQYALDHGYTRYWFRDYSPVKKAQHKATYLKQMSSNKAMLDLT